MLGFLAFIAAVALALVAFFWACPVGVTVRRADPVTGRVLAQRSAAVSFATKRRLARARERLEIELEAALRRFDAV